MTRRALILIAALGSLALLLGAFAFQYWGGLAPCKMCIWQRWPHGIAIGLGVLGMLFPHRLIALLGAITVTVGGAIGVYHVGVEQKWWEGPNTCTSGSLSGLSSSEALDAILAAPLVRCDEIAWSLIGISMAGWNAILSALFLLFWLRAFRL